MSKRAREEQDTTRPPKRSKPDYQPPAVEEIHYARQLQQFLVFRQDGIHQLRNGIASFKAFLETILYRKEEDNRGRLLSILREYLDSQKPADVQDISTPFLAQLWQAWSYASQNNNDYLSSSHQHLRLVKRGLDAPKHKDFVVSPCLRLLTEVVSFDGGALAREAYKRREQTFDINSVRRNLGLYRAGVSEEEAKRKPSVRTLTVRYVLAHLKYLHEGGKVDLLKSRPLCIALLHHLADDPADVVNEILSVTEQNVLKDTDLPRSVKGTFLTQHNLERVTEVATRSPEDHAAADRAFAWLKSVCTSPSYGVLRESGWYPAGTTKLESNVGDGNGAIDLGLDSIDFYDRAERPDVRNSTLLDWCVTLRPHSDVKERELLLACFTSAPELVAPYFAEKNMQLEPKLSNTWIGYASFLFEVIRLDVPSYLGNAEEEGYAELPPQTSIVLENVLPRPLTQKTLTRCLNQSSELITFFAIRILVLATQKLWTILEQMRRAAKAASGENARLWTEAIERTLAGFTQRAPSMKDIIAAFRKISDDDEHALQREAVTRLLRLYFEVTPLQALDEPFDVSAALTTALSRGRDASEVDDTDASVKALRSIELEHLLVIVQHSSGMKWFGKQGGLDYSPIVSLLRLHLRDLQNRQIRSLVRDVLTEYSLITQHGEVDALLASLLRVDSDDEEVWTFVDDCLARATRQPVKYVDQLESAVSEGNANVKAADEDTVLPGLLVMTVVEQTAFVHEKPEVMTWIDMYLAAMGRIQNVGPVFAKLTADISRGVSRPSPPDKEACEEQLTLVTFPVATEDVANGVAKDAATLPFVPPATGSDDHPELFRWAQKDLGRAIEDGDIDGLILCLCSQHHEIRVQALAQIRLLFGKLKGRNAEESGQMTVLIGELIETYEQQYLPSQKALPYLTGCFAKRALAVLNEPTHFIYPKLCRFMMKSPEWRSARLPSYWLANTVHAQPVEDDAYWREVHWVVEWLVDGLTTSADLEMLRRGDVFEKIMAVYSSPGAGRMKALKSAVLELLYRASWIEGGCDVLVSRAGVLSWLEMVKGKGKEDDVPSLLRTRILEGCDRERMVKWSGGVGVDQL
ncbi:hypothetical protein LTR78_002273 [Recurvomyces mirabilis]|uniref:Nucleolar pre-ribosomal-associated protein 1 n=1 Tax=Recurvomyces mirabilis TaxID=574656 RepID=A0AAE0WUR0_9PEZI|nr:hypothetical protein LTR78_002273 [Recurvomyces mirabilis]KAK5160727.1 hypothetical protein LTS14_001740 [Recurvomyces mirabilis]